MQKLLIVKRRESLNKGFTTFEILVSIIIALAFVSVAMQSFVLAMGMKVVAQEKQRANQLIQEDLERLSDLASIIAEDHSDKCNPVAITTGTTSTAYDNGYAKKLWDEVEPAGSTPPSVKLLSDGSGKTLTLARTPISNTSSTAPHRTLKINYQVKDSDDDVIAERYVEVIPDVALQCP